MFSVFGGRLIVGAAVYFRCFWGRRVKTCVLCENKELTTVVIADNLKQMDFVEVSVIKRDFFFMGDQK